MPEALASAAASLLGLLEAVEMGVACPTGLAPAVEGVWPEDAIPAEGGREVREGGREGGRERERNSKLRPQSLDFVQAL